MKKYILWAGNSINSMERCMINHESNNILVTSSIIGSDQNETFIVNYELVLDLDWLTKSLTVSYESNTKTYRYDLIQPKPGEWVVNGEKNINLDNHIDVDISLTPFTNTLPIKRLKLLSNQQEIIKVVYLNLLDGSIKGTNQKYSKLDENEYRFETVPNDFESIITVDTHGFVVEYPKLFKRLVLL